MNVFMKKRKKEREREREEESVTNLLHYYLNRSLVNPYPIIIVGVYPAYIIK